MKKLYYFLIAFCFIANASAQTITFPDANFKARLLSADVGIGIAYNSGGSFKIDANDDNEIQVSEALLVNDLVLYNCGISNLSGLEYFINLTHLNCGNNTISTLDLSPFPDLIGFDAYNNNLTSLTVSGLTHLTNFSCFNNQLTSLTLSGLPTLYTIFCGNNQLTSLNVNSLTNLSHLNCNNNQLTSLEINNLTHLTNLNCASNNLTSLYLKNGSYELLEFSNNPNLEYICADDIQLTQVQEKIALYGYSNCYVNSYCSHTAGAAYYSINGTIQYDEDNDGCDAFDIAFPNLKLSFSDGTNTGSAFGNDTGDYNYSVQAGTHTVQPVIANPAYFNVPSASNINFPTQSSPYTQNFCITPNGLHPDLDISITQIDNYYTALPGSDNTYKIIYKNKGTNTQSGSINFTFDDAVLEYSSSNPTIYSQSTNTLVWSYSSLKPFESREILVTLYLNSNTASPPVNEGDVLNFSSTIDPVVTDETPNDNTFTFYQAASNIVLLSTTDLTKDNYFTLYPNPVTNMLNIETNDSIEKEAIEVYNMMGQLVLNIPGAKTISSVDVSNLEMGHYFIRIQTDKGAFKNRFVKK